LKKWENASVVITDSCLGCFRTLFTKQKGREVHVLDQELKEMALFMEKYKAKGRCGIPNQVWKVLVTKLEVTEELSKLFHKDKS
jgi:hypothetical protein